MKIGNILYEFRVTEAVVRRCSVEKVFLEISRNSQENTSTYHSRKVVKSMT